MNFFVLLCWSLHASIVPSLISKNTILLGSIQFNQSVDREIELPVLYKGKEYNAKVEKNGDSRKAHFELYEEEKPQELYVLITEYLSLPENPNVEHLCTSEHHNYRLFKLTCIKVENTNDSNEMFDTWRVEEVSSSKKIVAIPDNTIIVFMDPKAIEKIQPISWSTESNIMRIPMIKLKESLTKNALYDMADKMKLTLLDSKFLHKKAHLASIPYANNRLLSMPFATQRAYT